MTLTRAKPGSPQDHLSIIIKTLDGSTTAETMHPNKKGEEWSEEVAQPGKWQPIPSQRHMQPSRQRGDEDPEISKAKRIPFLP
jgi:hypothetical protein